MFQVKLLSHTPDPQRLVAAAAKLCYSAGDTAGLLDNLDEQRATDFVEMLSEIGHESPIEHAAFTFAIEGVSRAFLAQMTRHRLASYSVQSQRYVREDSFEFVIPPEIEEDPQAKSLFIQAMERAQASYEKLSSILKDKHYQRMIAGGMEEKAAKRAAEKQAIEDARFVLPNACDTKMIVTMNARSLLNFFRHRCCNRAQWEIRRIAKEMLGLVYETAPALFSKAGPPCLNGSCPEGKMSCGQMARVRQDFALLKSGGGKSRETEPAKEWNQ